MSGEVTVILADDHAMVRSALARLLNDTPGLRVVAECATSDDAVSAAIRLAPRVLVMDIDIPGVEAFDAARSVMARSPETRVIYLSAFSSDRYIEEALRAHAVGYVTKSEPSEVIVKAIREAAAGGSYFSPQVQARIVVDSGEASLKERAQTRVSLLTLREVEVLRYIARGKSKKEIGSAMKLSVKTIENHATSLMNKLDIHDRVELTRFALREGLIEL
jgi:DNA-binding NarL/FixJ family response regulator